MLTQICDFLRGKRLEWPKLSLDSFSEIHFNVFVFSEGPSRLCVRGSCCINVHILATNERRKTRKYGRTTVSTVAPAARWEAAAILTYFISTDLNVFLITHRSYSRSRVHYINLTNELSHGLNKSTRTIMYFNKKC